MQKACKHKFWQKMWIRWKKDRICCVSQPVRRQTQTSNPFPARVESGGSVFFKRNQRHHTADELKMGRVCECVYLGVMRCDVITSVACCPSYSRVLYFTFGDFSNDSFRVSSMLSARRAKREKIRALHPPPHPTSTHPPRHVKHWGTVKQFSENL